MASMYTEEERMERQKAASRRYYYANLEKSRARIAKYKADNPEKVKAYRDLVYDPAYWTEWRKANPGKAAGYVKKHDQKESRKTRHLSFSEAQKAQRVQSSRKWQKANPEAVRAKTSNRRAIVKSFGRLSRGIVKKLLSLQKKKCANCLTCLSTGYHVDHIEPLAKGGSNTDGNVQLLCPTCNMKKGAKDPIAWAQAQGRLL